jgi:hypothetical protein
MVDNDIDDAKVPSKTTGNKVAPLPAGNTLSNKKVFEISEPAEDNLKLTRNFLGPKHAYEELQLEYLNKVIPL